MLWALVMAGGWGTRLWPLSNQKNPKPFLKILPGEKSLFQETLARVRKIVPNNRIFIIGNEKHLTYIRSQAKGIPAGQILGEPESKNTASAVALAAYLISNIDSFATLLVLPADHLIKDDNKFKTAVQKAKATAQQNQAFCIFGVRPNFPSDSYGYLEQGRKVSDGIFELKRFVEKPDRKKADRFLKTRRFSWHAGIFLAPVEVILDALNRFSPEILRRIRLLSVKKGKIIPRKIFACLPNISIDYAVLEKLEKAYMVAGTFDWCDVGTWNAFEGIWKKDGLGNAVMGQSLMLKSRENVIYSKEKLVCLWGVNHLVVIDTPEAVLVAPKNVTESAREIVKTLRGGRR